jgi:hypothetical protein
METHHDNPFNVCEKAGNQIADCMAGTNNGARRSLGGDHQHRSSRRPRVGCDPEQHQPVGAGGERRRRARAPVVLRRRRLRVLGQRRSPRRPDARGHGSRSKRFFVVGPPVLVAVDPPSMNDA